MSTAFKLFGRCTPDELWKVNDLNKIRGFVEAVLEKPQDYGIREIDVPAARIALNDFYAFDPKQNHYPVYLDAGTAKLTPKDYTRNGIAFKAYSFQESLLHGLSFTMPPPGATKEGYYRPYASVMARWAHLASIEHSPARFDIVYDEPDPGSSATQCLTLVDVPYIVGTTIPLRLVGLAKTQQQQWEQCKKWKDEIQQDRFKWMQELFGNQLPLTDPKISIMNPTGNGTGQLYGHCAETIPLLIKLKTTEKEHIDKIGGFVLEPRQIVKAPSYDALLDPEFWKKCVDNPCANCLEGILNPLHAHPSNFMAETSGFFKPL